MAYRVPDDERLLDAIEATLDRHPMVESQRELGKLVRRQLHREDEELTASDERVRRLAVDNDLVSVRVRTGTTEEPAREACPVCDTELEQVRNRTLTGDETVVGTRCPKCPYTSGHHHEVPLRYEFVRANGPTEEEVQGPF